MQVLGRVSYVSKTIFGRYIHNLKKETKGISPGLFLTGVGMLLNGGFVLSRAELIEDEGVAFEQRSAAWSQISIGAAFTVTPFFKAAIKTATQ